MNKLGKIYKLYHATGALLLVLIVLAASFFYVLYGTRQVPNRQILTTIQSDNIDQQMVDTINKFRADRGLSNLKVSTNLQNSAAWYAQDMASHNAADPSSPTGWKEPWNSHGDSLGRGFAKRIADFGYPGQSTENIVYWGGPGSDSNVGPAMNSWLGSQPHINTMSTPGLVMIGIARTTVPYQPTGTITYWVADFGFVDDGTSGGGGSQPTQPPGTCTPPRILDCGQFCHDPGDQLLGGGCCSNEVCQSGNCVNNKCISNSCAAGEILDCGAFCHVPGTQDDGQRCCDSRICKSGSCVNNVCVAKPTSPPITRPPNPTATTRPLPTVTTRPTATTVPGQPTATPTPIQSGPTATPGLGNITFSITLPGIGPNANLGMNPNPIILSKQGQIMVGNDTQDITFNFRANNFTFASQINLPSNTNFIKVRTDNSLWRQSSLSEQPVGLITGDLNQDNVLDLADYNFFLKCYGYQLNGQNVCPNADLNLDGKVDEKDLNIFYAGLANREGD